MEPVKATPYKKATQANPKMKSLLGSGTSTAKFVRLDSFGSSPKAILVFSPTIGPFLLLAGRVHFLSLNSGALKISLLKALFTR